MSTIALFSYVWLGMTKTRDDGYLGFGLDWSFGYRNPGSVIGKLGYLNNAVVIFEEMGWMKAWTDTQATDWRISFRLLIFFFFIFFLSTYFSFRNDTPWWNAF